MFHECMVNAGTELSERICVMGIAMNLVTYLVGDLHLPSAASANIVTNFLGTLNLLGLLGGFLADAKLGRYLTVSIFASITAVVSTKSQLIQLHTEQALATYPHAKAVHGCPPFSTVRKKITRLSRKPSACRHALDCTPCFTFLAARGPYH